MIFRELDPDAARGFLEGHADVLTPMVEKEARFLKGCACLKCGESTTEPFVDPQRPFSPSSPLPNQRVRCLSCQCEFDPRTGLITKVPVTGG